MAKWIKNNSGSTSTYKGQDIADGAYYEIQSHQELIWANNSTLLTDIANGDAIVAKDDSGSKDIADVNEAINYLKGILPTEVTTQKEKDNITLKLASKSVNVDTETGEALIEIKVPGIYANSEGRYLESGEAWFDVHHTGDKIVAVEIVDKDNILGYGAGVVVKKYHDDEADASEQGWRMNPNSPSIKVEALGGYGFAPGELYMRIKGQKSTGNYSGVMSINIKWGKTE